MPAAAPAAAGPPTIAIVAGEESGDVLGAGLMAEIVKRLDGGVRFVGVGGTRMSALGLTPMYPMEKLIIHGVTEALANAWDLLRRVRTTAAAIVAAEPAVLVLIDVPGFNQRLARRVRRLKPSIPIVTYVSPTVWAWAPWRARRMRPNVDRLMAILPFEPEVHRPLGGPPTTYVGHPITGQRDLRPASSERASPETGRPVLLVLPGSRRSEVERLMDRFGETVALVAQQLGALEVILPAVAPLADDIRARAARWAIAPTIVTGDAAKFAAFRRAHAALAASGTVTLELALAEVPMVVAYRVDPVMRLLKPLLRAPSIVLANLIAGENAIPEFLDNDANPETLSAALIPLFSDTPERRRQLKAFAEIERRMRLPSGTPSGAAADIVLETMRRSGA